MGVLARLFDFADGQIIFSADVDAEFNQLINLLSGISTNKELSVKLNDANLAPLNADQTGAGPIALFKKSGVTKGRLNNLGYPQTLINASEYQNPVGTFKVFEGSVPNSGAAETDLYNQNILANTLTTDGEYLRFSIHGSMSGVNNKRVRVYFGTDLIYDTLPIGAANSDFFWIQGILFRVSSDTANTLMYLEHLGSVGVTATGTIDRFPQRGQPSVAGLFAADRAFRVTGQADSGSAIFLFHLSIEKGGLGT